METSRALEELRARVDAELVERAAAGLCGCPCAQPLPSLKRRRRYIDDRHRQRAYRRRLELEAEVLGIPARLSVQALQASNPTSIRHADAPARRTPPQATKSRRPSRPRPGLSVYVPSLALAERLLTILDEGRAIGWDTDELEDAVAAAVKRRRRREGLEP